MNDYKEIYMMKPIREVHLGWWKLKWKPIWFGTYFIYFIREDVYCFKWAFRLGFEIWKGGAHNGWGRSFDRLDIRVSVGFFSMNFWIRWNYIVMAEGPSDVEIKRPLDLPKKERQEKE